jgi:hypothetical protein
LLAVVRRLNKKIAKEDERRVNALELEQEMRKNELESMPDWVLEVPSPDATGYFAVGYGESKVIFKAIKKSILQAEFGLAKAVKQEISGSERAYEQDSGAGTEQENYQLAIDKIVDGAQIVGYSQIEQKAIAVNGKHTVYTLLKMPYEQYNKILLSQRAKALSEDSEKAFDDLQERLAKRQEQRIEQENLKHKREMERLKLEHTLNQPVIEKTINKTTENKIEATISGV